MRTIRKAIWLARTRWLLLVGVAAAAGLGISAGAWSASPAEATGKAAAAAGRTGLLLASKTDYCGDSYCDTPNESCSSCPDDCGRCCGNGYCGDSDENCETCPDDCGTCPPTCPNGACQPHLGETCDSCPGDCGPCPDPCGDGVCDRDHESCRSCPQDCGGCGADGQCFPNQPECEAACRGVCERRISCGGASAHKCFE